MVPIRVCVCECMCNCVCACVSVGEGVGVWVRMSVWVWVWVFVCVYVCESISKICVSGGFKVSLCPCTDSLPTFTVKYFTVEYNT